MSETRAMEITEVLARMWIDCDPNRERGSGDQDITLHESGKTRHTKRWEWFTPRADASLEYLDRHGFKIVPKDAA